MPSIVGLVPERQLVRVVSTGISDAELARVRSRLGRDPLVLVGPTPEGARVVRGLQAEPTVELALAPVRFPPTDRGHQLDALVRNHALADRYRDVVVVVDAATAVLLLRVLAPDQLAEGGPVTIVGLPRAARQLVLWRAVVAGVVLGLFSSVAEASSAVPLVPLLTAVVGLVLLALPDRRHLGREVLLAAGIAITVVFVIVAGSARFPGGSA